VTEGVLLLAAGSCHAGIAALLNGAPVLNGRGVSLRPWADAVASVVLPLLTVAGFGVVSPLGLGFIAALFVVGWELLLVIGLGLGKRLALVKGTD